MIENNRITAIIIRGISIVVAITGIIAVAWTDKGFDFSIFLFYTLMSNVLALVYFIITFIKTIKDYRENGKDGNASYFPLLAMVIAVNILITLVVFWVLLAPYSFRMEDGIELFSYENLAVHTFTPLLMVLDYLILNKREAFKFRRTFLILIFPYAYALFAIILGLTGYVFYVDSVTGEDIHYPYYFINIEQQGPNVIIYLLVLSAIFIGIGSLCYLLNKKVSKSDKVIN